MASKKENYTWSCFVNGKRKMGKFKMKKACSWHTEESLNVLKGLRVRQAKIADMHKLLEGYIKTLDTWREELLEFENKGIIKDAGYITKAFYLPKQKIAKLISQITDDVLVSLSSDHSKRWDIKPHEDGPLFPDSIDNMVKELRKCTREENIKSPNIIWAK
jgi:hypothetical protein